jgi:hypothetical protein
LKTGTASGGASSNGSARAFSVRTSKVAARQPAGASSAPRAWSSRSQGSSARPAASARHRGRDHDEDGRDEDTDEQLTFDDHVARYFMREQHVPPVAGRVLGYLAVCEPAAQTTNELSEALLASRSAITQAVVLLENRGWFSGPAHVASAWIGLPPARMPQHSSGASTRLASPTRQHCSGAEPRC